MTTVSVTGDTTVSVVTAAEQGPAGPSTVPAGGTPGQVVVATEPGGTGVPTTGWETLTPGLVGADPAGAAATVQGALTTEVANREAADALLVPLTQLGAANGVATLGSTGLLTTSQIPPVTIGTAYPVTSQAAMLALAAEPGDVAIRSDVNESFILGQLPASTLANWLQLLFPIAVSSVDGQTGAVVLPADAVAGTPALRTLGTGATQAAAGDDSRITGAATAASVTALSAELAHYVPTSEVGVASGVAALDAGGALLSNTAGGGTTAAGYAALGANTTGYGNTAAGYSALGSNTTGYYNTAAGFEALGSNTVGGANAAAGFEALGLNTTGANNTAAGFEAGYTAVPANATTTASGQTLIGCQTGQSSATQVNYITAIGYQALCGAPGATAIGTDSTGKGAVSNTQDTTVIGTSLTTLQVARLALTSQPAFTSGDKYLVINAAGQVHVSATGPTS